MRYPYKKQNTKTQGANVAETIGIIVLIITSVVPFALIFFGMAGRDQ